ncbi:MAG: hypothetical protein E6G40_01675, partial [Actinobacteria bacterium]
MPAPRKIYLPGRRGGPVGSFRQAKRWPATFLRGPSRLLALVASITLLLTVFAEGARAQSITGFAPTEGPVGTDVRITGSDFSGATDVQFNGTSATFTIDDDTQISAVVPEGATTGPISVVTPDGTATSSDAFTVTSPPPVPTITGFAPTEGPVGTEVTITGSDFSGATDVQFNGTSAIFTIDSDAQISAVLPEGATTGPIAVVTPDGTATSADPFTATKPNIVLILTDDQRWDEMQMPTVQSELIGKGVDFVNGFVVNSLCCPSRTTILTGKYSHGTDVYSDGPPHGGFDTFKPEDGSTVATWLHDAGYRTGLVGKYLNGYKRATASYVPAGWDRWVAATSGTYYNYSLSVDGSLVSYGRQASDYSTDVLASYATDFIQSAPPEQPLFLYFAPRAPHVPTIVPPRYKQACPDLQPLRPPSYNEADVSDKPAFIQALARLSRTQRAKVDADHRHHCQMLLAVDDAVQAIRGALEATGRLSTTLIVFASDNGIQFGEHRWTSKQVPYEESIRVPMVVRYDPMTRGSATVSDHLLLNLDFAP